MFERFTDQARRVVVTAQEEARRLGHGYIGTEHILLGLLSEGEGQAAEALGALDITLDAAREQVVVITGEGTGQPGGHIPFTPRTKKVLELSLREAQKLGDSSIGTEHILLGLAREGEGVGAQVLDRLGANPDRVLAQVLATVRAAPPEEVRRVSAARTMGGRGPVERLFGLREVITRLDAIAERLTAIENLLAGQRNPAAAGPEGEPAAGPGTEAAAGPGSEAAAGQGSEPAAGQGSEAAGGGQEAPGQPEPPAAEA